eukprot:7279448-Prymnesium_polylepis.2
MAAEGASRYFLAAVPTLPGWVSANPPEGRREERCPASPEKAIGPAVPGSRAVNVTMVTILHHGNNCGWRQWDSGCSGIGETVGEAQEIVVVRTKRRGEKVRMWRQAPWLR